jgi:hypothetical protein
VTYEPWNTGRGPLGEPDASAALAVAVLKDQFLVGLLDEDSEEPTLDFETGLMDRRFDPLREMLILGRHGQGHPQRQLERDCMTVTVDGTEVDGSLKAVGSTRGVSPYWNNGVHPACFFIKWAGKSATLERNRAGKTPLAHEGKLVLRLLTITSIGDVLTGSPPWTQRF